MTNMIPVNKHAPTVNMLAIVTVEDRALSHGATEITRSSISAKPIACVGLLPCLCVKNKRESNHIVWNGTEFSGNINL